MKKGYGYKRMRRDCIQKSQSNPGLGMPENEACDIATEKMKDASESNYHSLS